MEKKQLKKKNIIFTEHFQGRKNNKKTVNIILDFNELLQESPELFLKSSLRYPQNQTNEQIFKSALEIKESQEKQNFIKKIDESISFLDPFVSEK